MRVRRLSGAITMNQQLTTDPYDVIFQFEQEIATFTGSIYAVAVDTCSAALFLCCKYLRVQEVTIPAHTYVSVPCAIIHAGGTVKFEQVDWKGIYQLKPYKIWDSALRLRRKMYVPNSFMCLSFQYRKHLPIGRGGMILTDDAEAVKWFHLARFHGRQSYPIGAGDIKMVGWPMYMEPERAAKGLILLLNQKDDNPDLDIKYPDLSECEEFK